MDTEVYERIAQVLSEKFFVDPKLITPESTMKDLDLDSLASVEAADVIQKAIGTRVADSMVVDATVGELADILTDQLRSAK